MTNDNTGGHSESVEARAFGLLDSAIERLRNRQVHLLTIDEQDALIEAASAHQRRWEIEMTYSWDSWCRENMPNGTTFDPW